MSIRLILRGRVKDGIADAHHEARSRLNAASQAEPGVINYTTSYADDGRFFHEEVYSDEAAFFGHVGAATQSGHLDAFMGTIDLDEVMALDPVNDEMAAALANFGATHYAVPAG